MIDKLNLKYFGFCMTNILWINDCNEVTSLDHANAVTGSLNLLKHMPGHKNAFAIFFFFTYEFNKGCLHQGIESAGWLVKNQYLGIMHEGTHNSDCLLYTSDAADEED